MNRKAHIIVQIILSAAQVLNLVAPILPSDKKVYALTAITILQGVVGIVNQAFNTDGTPQEVPFKKE